MMRHTLFAFAALATCAPHAAEIETTPLALPSFSMEALGDPVVGASGELWLTGTKSATRQRYRFTASGALLAAGPAWSAYGPSKPLFTAGHGDLRERHNSTGHGNMEPNCNFAARSLTGQLKWSNTADCVGSGLIDATGNTWWINSWPFARLGYWLSDGSTFQSKQLSDISAEDTDVSYRLLATSPSGSAALISTAVAESTKEVIEYNAQLESSWRFTPTLAADEQLRDLRVVMGRAHDHLIIGRLRQVGASADVLYAAQFNAFGSLMFERRYIDIENHANLALKRLSDGRALVYFAAAVPEITIGNTTYVGFTGINDQSLVGYALLRQDGAVIHALRSTQKFSHAPEADFLERADRSMLIFANNADANEGDHAQVWRVDGSSAPTALGIGEFGGVHVDGDRTLVFGGGLGLSAMVFDGAGNLARQPFATPSYSAVIEVLASAPDGAGGHYLKLRTPDYGVYLSRFSSSGALLWQATIRAPVDDDLTPHDDCSVLSGCVPDHSSETVLRPDDAHVCSGSTTELICFAVSDGQEFFRRAIATETYASPLLAAGNGYVDIGEQLSNGEVTHTRVASSGTLQFERNLGVGDLLWVADGEVTARIEDDTALVISRANVATPSHVALAADDLRRTHRIIARLAEDDFVFGPLQYDGDIIFGDPEPAYLVRYVGDAERWRQPGLSVQSAQLAVTSAGTRLVIVHRESDLGDFSERELLSVLAAESGQSVWSFGQLPWQLYYVEAGFDYYAVSPGRVAVDSSTGDIALVYPSGGDIVVDSYDASGAALSSQSSPCVRACELLTASMSQLAVDYLTRSTYGSAEVSHGYLADADFPRRKPIPGQRGISGVFVASGDVNRGYLIDYIPSNNTLFVARFAGENASATSRRNLDWETFQGPAVDTHGAITLTRYQSNGGEFGRTTEAVTEAIGDVSLRFDGCDQVVLTLRRDATPSNGAEEETLHLKRFGQRQHACMFADAPADPPQIARAPRGLFDTRQSGAWLIDGASSQGILAAIEPATDIVDGVFFAPWFTYWPDAGNNAETGNRHWLTLQAPIPKDASDAVALAIYRSTAGSHAGVEMDHSERIGEAVWTFTSCERAYVSYTFDAGDHAWPYQSKRGSFIARRPNACNGGP